MLSIDAIGEDGLEFCSRTCLTCQPRATSPETPWARRRCRDRPVCQARGILGRRRPFARMAPRAHPRRPAVSAGPHRHRRPQTQGTNTRTRTVYPDWHLSLRPGIGRRRAGMERGSRRAPTNSPAAPFKFRNKNCPPLPICQIAESHICMISMFGSLGAFLMPIGATHVRQLCP